MLNSGKKICASRDKKKYILTLVFSEKKILNETKSHNPPLQVKWSVLIYVICVCLRTVMSSTYCVAFLLCFSSSSVPYVYVTSFSGLSILDFLFGFI